MKSFEPMRAAVARLRCHPIEALIFATVLGSCAYFFQGGGWNQNAHFATTVALVDSGTLYLDDYRHSTGDLSRAGEHVASAKPLGTALAMIPGYLVSAPLTAAISNRGNRVIARAYLTNLLSTGLALALFAVVVFRLARRRLKPRDAAFLALAMGIATPLFPNSLMTNSAPWPALFGLSAYTLLETARHDGTALTRPRLVLVGLLAGMPAVFEYMTAVILLPLALYAAWQLSRRYEVIFFAAGVALAAMIPLTHHMLLYGNPLHVGYASLISPGFARDAEAGWMGFRDLSLRRLYDLTFGANRGYFFLSPFLVASIPGLVRMLRDRHTRPEGLVVGGISWMVILLVASLVYWHSGWSLSSRYGLLFVAFACVPLSVIWSDYRRWLLLGVFVGFISMVAAAAVTASPPPPGPRAPRMTVTGWLLFRYEHGDVPRNQQPVLRHPGHDTGEPTWNSAFNLGRVIGLPPKVSPLPYLLFVAMMLRAVWRRTANDEQPDTAAAEGGNEAEAT